MGRYFLPAPRDPDADCLRKVGEGAVVVPGALANAVLRAVERHQRREDEVGSDRVRRRRGLAQAVWSVGQRNRLGPG